MAKSSIGIDLGTRKTGLCLVRDGVLAELKVVESTELVENLNSLATAHGVPSIVVVDAPIDASDCGGFRLVDRVFMRGQFNNNHCGLQPNNPDLLDMGQETESVREWCERNQISYSNEFPGGHCGGLRETFPNVLLGVLSTPDQIKAIKAKLRFRYGRGQNVAPIAVAFECLAEKDGFLSAVQNVPKNWDDLQKRFGTDDSYQGDDLIAALACGVLGWWAIGVQEYSYVRETRGHYLLAPAKLIKSEWKTELRDILRCSDFSDVKQTILDDAK